MAYQFLCRRDAAFRNTVRARRVVGFDGLDSAAASMAVVIMALLTLADSGLAAPQSARPPFELITRAAEDYFKSLPDYRTGDLLTQSNIDAALDAVRNTGWDVPDSERIAKLAVADDSFLARQFAEPAGRKFMRKTARHAGAYARLDRLSSVSSGQKLIRELSKQPDGDKLIEYMATTRGGHNMGNMVARARQGVELNKPTGRIYTAADLLAELARVYAATKE